MSIKLHNKVEAIERKLKENKKEQQTLIKQYEAARKELAKEEADLA